MIEVTESSLRGRSGGGEPLHEHVRKRILRQLAADWNPGLKLPAMRELAEGLDVSVGTVQQAVRALVRDGILLSRPHAGTVANPECDLARVRDSLRRPLNGGAGGALHLRGRLVQVMHPSGNDAMVNDMIDTFAEALAATGCRLDIREYECMTEGLVTVLRAAEADALVVFQTNLSHLAIQCEPHQVALTVSADHHQHLDLPGRYDILSVDDEQGSFLAGQRLRAAGCREACFIGGGNRDRAGGYDRISVRRLAGFERGWGTPVSSPLRLVARSYDVDRGAEVVPQYMRRADRPEAVYAATDDLALGFVLGAKAHGLEPGRDYSIVGFDRQARGVHLLHQALTTVEVPRVALGRRAAELIVSRLKDPDQPVRREYVGCSLFEGETVRKSEKEVSL